MKLLEELVLDVQRFVDSGAKFGISDVEINKSKELLHKLKMCQRVLFFTEREFEKCIPKEMFVEVKSFLQDRYKQRELYIQQLVDEFKDFDIQLAKIETYVIDENEVPKDIPVLQRSDSSCDKCSKPIPKDALLPHYNMLEKKEEMLCIDCFIIDE